MRGGGAREGQAHAQEQARAQHEQQMRQMKQQQECTEKVEQEHQHATLRLFLLASAFGVGVGIGVVVARGGDWRLHARHERGVLRRLRRSRLLLLHLTVGIIRRARMHICTCSSHSAMRLSAKMSALKIEAGAGATDLGHTGSRICAKRARMPGFEADPRP